MNESLQNKLFEEYPEFFENRKLDRSQSPMYYGITCDDGWYNIIDCTCCAIKRFLIQNPTSIQFEFDQIKEKFGGLRMYYKGGDYKDYIAGTIRLAENLSYKTCEVTGNKGNLCVKDRWFKTLCPEKAQELGFSVYESKKEQSNA